jgi:phosphoesterase RecJ-like protein
MSESGAAREWTRAIRLIETSSGIYVATHIRPDGDALGSLLGLSLALEKAGLQVAALCADPVPSTYAFLPAVDWILSSPPDWQADVGIVVDCDGLARVGALEPALAGLPSLIDLDHHDTEQAFGQEQLIDPTAGASAEIVYDLLREMELPLDAEISTCLYAAVLTDTGRFCYGNTTARSLRIAAELVAGGADPHAIARKVYEERSMAATHLLGVALSRLAATTDGQVVSSVLRPADFAETGASSSDTDGIIAHLRAIGGPRVAILFVEPDHDAVRVSLRSDGSVDVSEIALEFGGGGHAMAAGCTVTGKAELVERRVLDAVSLALNRPSEQDAG